MDRSIALFDPHWRGFETYVADIGSSSSPLKETLSIESKSGHVYKIDYYNPNSTKPVKGWILISDSYTTSNLSYYFPYSCRIAVLKESPRFTRRISSDELASRYPLVITHRKDLLQRGGPFVRADYSSCFMNLSNTDFQKEKLVSFIGNIQHGDIGGYALRRKVAEFVSEFDQMDMFGRGIRKIADKTEAIAPYFFSIATENDKEDFYYSEKLIDCIMCETVPIYWGCPSIREIFDERGLIQFDTVEELNTIIGSLSVEKYRQMQPYVISNRKTAIKKRLDSYRSYWQRIVETMETHIDYPKPRNNYSSSKLTAGLRYAKSRVFS